MIRYMLRGVTHEDERDLLDLARHLNTVNLPNDGPVVREIIDHSVRSFSRVIQDPRQREYTFVIEDLEARRVVGTSKIIAQLGRRESPYVYLDVITEEKYSATVDKHFVHTVLCIGYSYDGPTEIGGLIVHPDARKAPEKVGLMISYVRFLFMALHRGLFRNEVVAELLPPLEPDGTSRLWEALGRHFMDMSYLEADLLSKRNKEFITSLFPSGDIYASLLPKEAQAVIGKVGRETRGVEKMLRRIGFQYCNRIDPFDGGPHFRAVTDEIQLVQRTRRTTVARVDESVAGRRTLVAVERKEAPFLECVGVITREDPDGLVIDRETAEVLRVGPGSAVTALPLD